MTYKQQDIFTVYQDMVAKAKRGPPARLYGARDYETEFNYNVRINAWWRSTVGFLRVLESQLDDCFHLEWPKGPFREYRFFNDIPFEGLLNGKATID